MSLFRLYQRLDMRTVDMKLDVFSWSGCPAAESCLHYQDGDRDLRKPVHRATALCRACSKASAKRAERRRGKEVF